MVSKCNHHYYYYSCYCCCHHLSSLGCEILPASVTWESSVHVGGMRGDGDPHSAEDWGAPWAIRSFLTPRVAMNLSSGREMLTEASDQKGNGGVGPFPNFSL